MKKTYVYILFSIITYLSVTHSCVEPVELNTLKSEDLLVVEATLTNELKNQEIKLSRTFLLDSITPISERSANVQIVDDEQKTYSFNETSPGIYTSTSMFAAQPNTTYQLSIITTNGKSYSSKLTQLTKISQIDNVYAERVINDDGVDGLAVYVNSYNPNGNAKYYRYEYEETYKIVAPYWNPEDLVVVEYVVPPLLAFIDKTKEERVCFKTVYSNKIIQTETSGFIEDRVKKFPVRFIPLTNGEISRRYSIVVSQYVQSIEAFTFYSTLNDFSGSESILSANQPGFFSGNVFSNDDPNEKVIGFFEVSSVTTFQRVYFNFDDFFRAEKRPYFTSCFFSAPLSDDDLGSSPLASNLNGRPPSFKYHAINEEPNEDFPGPYLLVNAACGDCTRIGSNIVPDFWID